MKCKTNWGEAEEVVEGVSVSEEKLYRDYREGAWSLNPLLSKPLGYKRQNYFN